MTTSPARAANAVRPSPVRTTTPVASESAAPYRLVFQPEGRLLEAARACEAEVFDRTYGNTAADLDAEYRAYNEHSAFVALATQDDDDVVGIARMIYPGPAGLKTVNDLGGAPWNVDGARAVRATGADLARTWDVATLAVLPGRKLTYVAAAALYHALISVGRANDAGWIVMMLDERARRLVSMIGLRLQPILGTAPGPYLGSPMTTPLIANFPRMVDTQRTESPDSYRLITQGIGLDGVSSPGLDAFRLTRRPAPGAKPLAAIA